MLYSIHHNNIYTNLSLFSSTAATSYSAHKIDGMISIYSAAIHSCISNNKDKISRVENCNAIIE